MKINEIKIFSPFFKGERQDRKTVSQLKENNAYDLNLPNQRKINEAIENLAKIKGEENILFLLNVDKNLKYGTNIDLGKESYNNWHTKLINAAEKALEKSDDNIKSKYSYIIEKAKSHKEYSADEKELLKEQKDLLNKIDFKEIEKIDRKNIRNIRTNLDYFIISSEIPTTQKLYILKRLNYFMSDDYKINNQLKDKKNQALAEIINDIVVDTPESEIPNSKEINQLHHGICASISICRKTLAYEDKANYVDMVMSELDDSENLMIYDISKLGSHTKIPVPKIDIDFKTALDRGYRIVDTAAMYWMNVADSTETSNESYGFYSPIDSNFFDTFTDAHMLNDISKELSEKHDYYRGLTKAKSVIGDYKANIEKNKFLDRKNYSEFTKNIERENNFNKLIRKNLYELATPEMTEKDIRRIFNELKTLQVKNSKEASKITDSRKSFIYLHNEEESAKLEKIEGFLALKFPNANSKLIKSHAQQIFGILDEFTTVSKRNSGGIAKKLSDSRSLYEAAAAYRTQQFLQLSVPEYYKTLMMRFNIPDNETTLIQNIDTLIKQIDKGTINPKLSEKLAENFEVENNPEVLTAVLKEIKNQVEYITTNIMDKFYNSIVLIDRHHALAIQLEYLKNQLDIKENKQLIKEIAQEMHLKENKQEIQKYFQEQIDLLESGKCSQEDYIKIFNRTGLKSQIQDFTDNFEKIAEIMFTQKRENVIKGFNLLNGLAQDAPIEHTKQKFIEVAQNFDKIDALLCEYHNALNIKDENGNILNTTDPKQKIMKKLEDLGEIPTEKELKLLRRRFDQIDKLMANKENNIREYADLPKSYTEFTPAEKEALKKYRSNINSWYSTVNKRLVNIFRAIREPLEQHNRETGVKTGFYWVPGEGNSGLYTAQEVKIIQHMTDRPYYSEEDGKKAIDKIKNGIYSGVSSTSVDHTRPAMHAQYIADIKPVILNNGEAKNIVFHDNSWGAIEKENTWRDTQGLTRTDYAREYGGELGYVTNEKYLNGNLEENILNKVGESKPQDIENKKFKKIKGESEEYKFPLLTDIISAGVYPKAALTASSIRNNFIISPFASLPDLEKYAHTMTKAQLKKSIERCENAGKDFNERYDKIIRRINGNKPFDKGIETIEDYNKLPENDEIKILMEKIAIMKSYYNITGNKDFIDAKNVKDLEKLKSKVKAIAQKDFYYTFGKDNDIRNYTLYTSNEEIADLMDEWIKENNIKAKTKNLVKVLDTFSTLKASDLDGSMQHTIDKMVKIFSKELSKQTPHFENKKEEIEKFSHKVREVLVKNNYLSSTKELELPHIEQWIDKNFAPKTNEEFIKIFNNLRDLTTEEFKKMYSSSIDNDALGIKNITGFDILKEIRAEHETVINTLYNHIYQQEFYKDLTNGKVKSSFDYNKLSRDKNNLATYEGGKTFDDIYTDYNESLSLLRLDKLFNKWKDQNYKKYGVLPAYPTVPVTTQEKFDAAMEEMYQDIEDRMTYIYAYNAQIKSMNIIKNLQKHINKYKNSDDKLTIRQYNSLWNDLNDFLMINEEDETMQEIVQEITDKALSGTKSITEYKELINKMYEKLSAFETTADGETVENAKIRAIKNLKKAKQSFLQQLFEPKYQQKASVILNKWISAKAKASMGDKRKAQEASVYYEQFSNMYKKYSILKTPEKVLEEFLMLNAKDGERLKAEESSQKRKELDSRSELLMNGLKGFLFKANIVELQMMIMRCIREGNLNAVANAFRNSKIELGGGSYIPLTSPDGLNMLFSSLMSKENTEILSNFFNQMGLVETVLETVTGKEQFEDARKNLRRIHSILSSGDKQMKFLNKELENIDDIEQMSNYEEILEEIKNNIIAKVRKTNYRGVANLYEAAFNDIKKEIKENPNMPKKLIIDSNINILKKGIRGIISKNIEILSSDLRRIGEIQEIIQSLNIPENSKASQLAKEYLDECDKLLEFQEGFPKEYKNLEMVAN